eukprot:GFYU01001888.1.p1 GENE.GFYU01001888.1~~GFYU01001888.1.p1  ORF type:complete len:434 (-),score=118.82 GFYU01001888.1:274-1575(-)
MNRLWGIVIALLAVAATSAMAKRTEIRGNYGTGVHFLDKFCFFGRSDLHFTVTAYPDREPEGVYLLIADDEVWKNMRAASWPRDDVASCQDLVNWFDESQLRSPSAAVKQTTGYVLWKVDGKSHHQGFDDNRRPHYWYWALLNCNTTTMSIKYEASYLNPGGFWTREISYDYQGYPEMYVVFSILFLIFAVIHIKGTLSLGRTSPLHPIIKLLTTAVALQFASLMFIMIHWLVYAGNGKGAPALDAIGFFIDAAANLIFLYLLLGLAMGWGISMISVFEHKKQIMGVLVAYFILYFLVFIWEYVARDPASTYYMYESGPGIVLIVARLLTLGWFLWLIYNTYAHESLPEKRRFYKHFSIVYSLWFLGLPFVVLMAAVLDPWVRAKTVTAIYLLITTIGFCYVGFWFWPTRAAQFFKIETFDLTERVQTAYDAL